MVLGSGNGKSKQWIHSPESLLNGKVMYTVKFLGKAEVPEPRGMTMVKEALQKLSFSRQIKRTEGTKPPKVDLAINIHSVTISNCKTKEALHNIALHRVSFCADDKSDKRLFAFIAKLDDNKHYCYGLDSLHQANDITLTIGQAFELAYEKFLKENPPNQHQKKALDMSKRIKELESENDRLRRRVAELEAASQASKNGSSASPRKIEVPVEPNSKKLSPKFDSSNIAIPRRSSPGLKPSANSETIDPFNMQPFAPKLPQPPSRLTHKTQANLMPVDPFDSAQSQATKDFFEMQNAFSKGLITSEEDLTLDSFDPLKR